jgi:neutral ceramidase
MRTMRWLAAAVALSQPGCFLLDVKHVVDDVTYSSGEGKPLAVDGYAVSTPHATGSFRAGVGAADITPPPGFPTGGHGPAGDVARGYWIRLKARAFFFEDATGRTLALVSGELFAIPAGLRAEVAARVVKGLRERKLDVAFSVDSLILAATHTHHGPGNFMTARSHNQFGSTYPGFSVELFRFLAGRIADAVIAAIVDARSNTDRVELAVHTYAVDDSMLLNRAPASFVLNRDRDELLARLGAGLSPMPHCPRGRTTPPGGWDLYGCPRLRAVDRALTVLEIARSGKMAGSLVFFAAHPSDLPADTPFYSPDFAGAALNRLEREHGAVFGFFNGAEGDVTLQRDARNFVEVEKFGAVFAKAIAAALQQPARTISDPSVVVKTATFRPSVAAERSCSARGETATLAPEPVIGTPALGGAEEDRTQLYPLGWRDGVRDRATPAQGVKLPALDSRIVRGLSLTKMLSKPEAFPDAIPLVVARLGDFTLATVPVELTTAAGLSVRRSFNRQHGELELVGLANEYHSYATTRDEYWEQEYAAASTIWGPDETAFLACRLAELDHGPETKRDAVPGLEYRPGVPPKEPFGLTFTGAVAAPDDATGTILVDEHGLPNRSLPWFLWTEPAPSGDAQFAQASERAVSVWSKANRGWEKLDDDGGDGLLTMYLGNQQWAALWLRPMLKPASGRFAFKVERKNAAPACSGEFSHQSRGRIPPAACSELN